MTVSLQRLARPALGIGVLLLVLLSADPAAVVARLGGADLRLAGVAILGLSAMHLVPAVAWQRILTVTSGVRLPLRVALSLFYAAQAIGGVTPANLGGDLHRAAVLRRGGRGWSAAVAPVIVQRATSYLALSALGLLGLAVVASQAEEAAGLVGLGVAAAVGVAATAWLLLAPPGVLRPAHDRLVRLVGGESPLEDHAPSGLGRAALIGLACGLVFHAGSVGLTWLLILAVDPSVASPVVLAALAVARVSLALPVTPSGIGVQEGALALLVTALGLPVDGALAGLLLARLALLLTTLVGVGLLIHGPQYFGEPGAASSASAPSAR